MDNAPLNVRLNEIDGALHEIGSMIEFAHRVIEGMSADDAGIFYLTYDSMNLLDFAVCDLDRRVKELRENIWPKPAKASVTVLRRARHDGRRSMSENMNCDNAGPDVFIGELTKVERLGSNRRLIFTMPDPLSPGWRQIVVKLIVPADYMVTLAHMIAGDGAKLAVATDLLAAMEPVGKAN
jgi:hypothetical protein